MKKLFNNPKPVVYAIAVFLVAFFSMRTCEAGSVEAGPTLLNGYGLVYTERLYGKWDVGIMLISEQQWDDVPMVRNNGGAFVQRIVSRGNFELGIGVARWINTSRVIGCEFGFALSAGYDFGRHWTVHARHWSNGGTCSPNRGQDLFTIGYRF